MDTQYLINFAVITVVGILGWFARQLWEAVQNLKNDMQRLEVDLPSHYVRKDELESRFDKLEAMLDRIFDKLDSKVDK